jgi:peptide/nickel transport system substrate-binding protein
MTSRKSRAQNRRSFIKTGLAATAVVAAPGRLTAQTAPAAARTLKAVMHGDLTVLDPIWTTANMTAYHGAMLYDTLFGLNGELKPEPQMVSKWGVSDNKLDYTFELRDGLKFSDGAAVTSDDVVASVKRWAARSGSGQHMMQRVKDIARKDEKSFTINLKEPYGLVLEALCSTSTPVCYIMRKKEADTNPQEKITEYVGSGPFTFNEKETKQGAQYVYDRNPNYVPRTGGTTVGMAGPKIAKLDRVIYQNIGDSTTAMAALQAGEIDFYETPPIDLIGNLEGDKNLTIDVLNKTGNIGWLRMNFLHPPFNNVDARRAMQILLNQEDFMKATFGNAKYYRKCSSNFGCGVPMENDANTAWFKQAPDLAQAKALLAKSGYKGEPIVLMQATNIDFMRNSADLIAGALRSIGANVQVASSDWGGVVTRRANKNAPDQGGWNLFITWADGNSVSSPIALAGHAAVGDKGWFGWPSDETHEKLRDKWALAPTLEDKQKVAREIQENAWNFVPHVWLGQWVQPTARRANVKGFLYCPGVIPFWNVEKA